VALQVKGKQPELWNPVTGEHRLLPAYTIDKNETTIPLKLHENESLFIVFRIPVVKANKSVANNFPEQNVIAEIKNAWQVSFDASHWGPEKPVTFNTLIDWTKSDDDKIKYYSGTAIYHNNFTVANLKTNQRMLLDLGTMNAMATIKINGVEAGGVWTSPYQLDITKYLKQGNNTLDIAVVNTWVNRLIGDLHLPEKERTTWTNVNPYTVDSPLEPSGLLGPVTIKIQNKK
jgi:hypothetical protein